MLQKIMENKKEMLLLVLNKGQRVLAAGGKNAWAASAPHAKQMAMKIYEKVDPEPISAENWYRDAAQVCEDLSDCILPEEDRIKLKIKRVLAGKLGAAGAAASVFSMASLLGTASTGTAIGSLSGAAFTSAALAWVGGSMFVGSVIVGGAAIAGAMGTVKASQWVKYRLYGKKKNRHDLTEQEELIVGVCAPLAIAFQQQHVLGQALTPYTAKVLHDDVLMPLSGLLNEYKFDNQNLPILSRSKLNDSVKKIHDLCSYLTYWLKRNSSITTGVISAVLLQLLAEIIPDFNPDERLVLEALQRSNTDLSNATDEELSGYVKAMTPEQLMGLHNNIKGIYHEKKFAAIENNDGDEYVVELFEATNHPGADVKIINTLTGEIKEVQLKATSYLSYIKEHNERYEDIAVFATTEVANLEGSIESTNLSNAELDGEVSSVFEELSDDYSPEVIASMSIAAIVTLARNAKVLLQGNKMQQNEKVRLVEDGVVSAGAAGLMHLIIG